MREAVLQHSQQDWCVSSQINKAQEQGWDRLGLWLVLLSNGNHGVTIPAPLLTWNHNHSWVNVGVMMQTLMLSREVSFLRIDQELLKKKKPWFKTWSLVQINHLKDLSKCCSSVDQVYVCSDSTGTTTNRSAKTQISSQPVHQQMSQEVDLIVDQKF